MKVFIAGATGFCGKELVRALRQHPKYTPIAHIRPNSHRLQQSELWSEQGVEVICASWSDLPAQLSIIQPEVIISVIGTTKRQMKSDKDRYHKIDYGLNHLLIQTAQHLSSPPLFIYLSSMGISWARWSAYLRARVQVEEELRSSELDYVIIRPGVLSGDSRDEDRALEALSASLSLSTARLLSFLSTPLSDKVRPLDAPEISSFILSALEHYQDQLLKGQRTQACYSLPFIHQTLRDHSLDRFRAHHRS